MKNNLKNRTLTNEAKKILFAYYFERTIDFVEAHNNLINLGIYLTEDDEIFDY